MRRITSTCIGVALALTLGMATKAEAQPCTAPNIGPFSIDGCVSGSVATGSNSKLVGNAPAVADVGAPGSQKELGPINSNTTKLGVINNAPTPMLGLTNPNAQVDLNTAYTQTEVDTTTGHVWYYFGWIRDSNNGSGVISIELQKSNVPSECTGTSGYAASNCNPWKNRADGDILIVWDQQGGGTEIGIRTYNGATHSFGPTVTLDATTSKAVYGSDLFRGELAIDFTAEVFPTTGDCVSFANTIPGTVTGNSDTADYKDVVLAPFAPVSNCGSVKITKVTSPAGQSGSFGYKLSATGDIFDGTIDSQCDDAADKTKCEATLTTPELNGSSTDTITGLLPKTLLYTLEEPATGIEPNFELTSISCVLDGATRDVYPGGQKFSVVATKTTECTITNTFVKGTPSQTTTQAATALIFDQINLTGIIAGASDAASAKATFRLYSDNACSTLHGTVADVSLTYTDGGIKASATTLPSNGIAVTLGVTYYWRVTYTGDAKNNGFTTPCTQESGTVTFTTVE
jgi:hypothetical protein